MKETYLFNLKKCILSHNINYKKNKKKFNY